MADEEMIERVARAIHFRGGDQDDDDWNHCQYWLRDVAREQARAAMVEIEAASPWQPIDTAPKDGTWIMLRGRNAVGVPMIPVVAAWNPAGSKHFGWVDSGSFKPSDNLAADTGADWAPLPK